MMKPIIYFRGSLAEEAEKAAAAKYFDIVERRTAIPSNSLVIPRYSALPYNAELEEDIKALGSQLINSHTEHVYVADLRNWYEHLEPYTPRTWFSMDQVPNKGPFILKGATNSKKYRFWTQMFAKDRADAWNVFSELSADSLIGSQSIYVREYIPLRRLCDQITSQEPPISEEYRFFVLDGKVLAKGFYWSTYMDDIEEEVNPDFVPNDFLQEVISRVAGFIRFFVIDIARTADGRWIIIELNDGQQSGLSAIDPDILYKNLRNFLRA
jgi:hypothetical protein